MLFQRDADKPQEPRSWRAPDCAELACVAHIRTCLLLGLWFPPAPKVCPGGERAHRTVPLGVGAPGGGPAGGEQPVRGGKQRSPFYASFFKVGIAHIYFTV